MNTKKSLKASGLSLVLCLAMLIGTTFAWFTDSITNSGNKIQAGNLKIGAMAYDTGADGMSVTIKGVNGGNPIQFEKDGQNLKEDNTPIINDKLFEPGKSNAKLLQVTNNGTLAAKIKLDFKVTDDGLMDSLWFDFVMVDDNGTLVGSFDKKPMSQLDKIGKAVELPLLNAGDNVKFVLVYGMNENADNSAQGKTFNADVSIMAKQEVKETDGFGNNSYDKNATYPVSSTTELENALTNAQNGETIQLVGNLKLTKTMSINKDLIIDGNGNTIISEKPVYVGAKNDVVIKDVEFTKPKNTNNNASSLYAEGLEGNLTLKDCKFVEFQWEGVQITPKAGANIVVDNCYFSNSKTMKESGITTNRYFHVEVTDRSTDINKINLKLTNNTFKNVKQSSAGGEGYFKDSVITSYGVPLKNIECKGNVFTGNVQADALNNMYVTYISDGFTNKLSYDGFEIRK